MFRVTVLFEDACPSSIIPTKSIMPKAEFWSDRTFYFCGERHPSNVPSCFLMLQGQKQIGKILLTLAQVIGILVPIKAFQ